MKQLSIKIDIDIEQLNDAICKENASIPSEHQKLILERKAKAKKNPRSILDWDNTSKLLRF